MNVSPSLRKVFRAANKHLLNPFGILLSKPETIHGSPAFSGATLWARRLNQTAHFFDLIQDVDGDIVESGVHWGYGLLIEWTLMKQKPRRIFGFDSFAGHSRPHANDLKSGDWQSLDDSFRVSEEDVWKTLEHGTGQPRAYLMSQIELVHGWMQETMPAFAKRAKDESIRLALVHADCDIYEPFKVTLTSTWDALQVGGIVVLGKLNNPELAGKTEAVKEFLAGRRDAELRCVEMTDNGLSKKEMSYLIKVDEMVWAGVESSSSMNTNF